MRMAKRLLLHLDSRKSLIWERDCYRGFASSILNRFLSGSAKIGKDADLGKEGRKSSNLGEKSQLKIPGSYDPELVKDSDDDEVSGWMWKKLELAWLSKALEPALQLYKWASTSGNSDPQVTPPSTRSLSEVFTKLQLSKSGIQDWSLSDLTVGLYLIYLSQASAGKVEDFKGVQITSDVTVQKLIYHIELAKGAYKDNATALARHCMLRERNIVKFVKHSSVLRPGYYIGIDTRNKLVIFGIRGTHTVYDLITDVVSTSDQEMSFEGFSTHFGTAEAAQWYLRHEMGTIRKCLEKHKNCPQISIFAKLSQIINFRGKTTINKIIKFIGYVDELEGGLQILRFRGNFCKDFQLRIVGHSLGGAAAALLAIMLRKKSKEELGFSPDIVSAVGFGTPPCVSKVLAEKCASYVSTVVLQDDIIPRLSVASLGRLRNEILETDWMSVLQKEDWKGILDLVTNAKQFVSSVQDVARRLSDYTKFRKMSATSDISISNNPVSLPKKPESEAKIVLNNLEEATPEELFTPGAFYYLKRDIEEGSGSVRSRESYSLWKRNPGEHFQRILLSGNLISDHKCDSHYYALRDVLKSLPASDDRVYF
ncbi:sn1-specific diacylglycerol lipase beta isoform X2 [Asparagus officinalis]|uniref:sn1-specific diacylglycerol lipase beta isoform X2 n=1 Tax=Asparagus officinalis TaxID=4686 RepID=UPI00098E3D27|nr:sn1-specific diacylglycerol lipase beta isoform X2 [Asparagus officinalis]